MAIKIVKKANQDKKRAVVTILGIQGANYDDDGNSYAKNYEHQARYYFENEDKIKKYYNTLPLLIERFIPKGYEIVPIYTQESKIFNCDILNKAGMECRFFDEKLLIEDDKDYNAIFKKIDTILDEYDRVIVDLTHGFRHLPLLMLIDLIIINFKDTNKIEHIYFAKEIRKHTSKEVGEYEIIDLKEYLDIANISFILTNFSENYTVANHIKSEKYSKLIDSLNDFSNDIMALNLNNLYKKSSLKLIEELDKIEDISVKLQAKELSKNIAQITAYKNQKRYKVYFDLANELFEKNYLLLSMSLMYESIRLYVKTTIKQQHKGIVEKIEQALSNDLYKIGDFFIKFKKDNYSYSKFEKDWKNLSISQLEFNKIKQAFPKEILAKKRFRINNNQPKSLLDTLAHTRNDLAHANAKKSFKDIKKDIKEILNTYKDIIGK